MIDWNFWNIIRLFVLSFKNGDNVLAEDSFDEYHMPFVEIKDFNSLIDNKWFLDQPVKNKQEGYEKLIEMSGNDDYKTGNLLDYLYHQNYYKLIGIDLSRQINMTIPQQVNFIGKLGQDNDTSMFFVAEKQQETMLNFLLDYRII